MFTTDNIIDSNILYNNNNIENNTNIIDNTNIDNTNIKSTQDIIDEIDNCLEYNEYMSDVINSLHEDISNICTDINNNKDVNND